MGGAQCGAVTQRGNIAVRLPTYYPPPATSNKEVNTRHNTFKWMIVLVIE